MEDRIDWVDLKSESLILKETPFQFDIRYATSDNFLNQIFYESPDAFLHRPVFEDLRRAHLEFSDLGFGVRIFDAYRPFFVTEKFWNLASEEQKPFLANPKNGSNHNRGCAIDCSLYELKTGKSVEMPSDFDEMNEKAWVSYIEGPLKPLEIRDLFIKIMQKNGFKVAQNEWWHFNHFLKSEMPISNLSFSEIKQQLRKIK